MKLRLGFGRIASALVFVFVLSTLLYISLQLAGAQQENRIEVLRVRPSFYMIAGAGGNIGVQIGADGVVLTDTGAQGNADRILGEIRKLTDQKVKYIINTSADADHVGNNAQLSKAGESIFPQANAQARAMTGGAASIMASEDVLTRMSAPTGKTSPYPLEAWPTETFHQKRNYMYFNNEGIEVFHQPAAHSDGDSIVFFRISDVVVAGDILDATRFPVIDLARGGSIQGEIDALDHLIELAIPQGPFPYQAGGTYVIPGHGRIYDQADVVEYRDMIVIIRDVIKDMMQKGMTLEQIKAASPAGPYEQQYGSKEGPWTTSAFVEAVYKSLNQQSTH